MSRQQSQCPKGLGTRVGYKGYVVPGWVGAVALAFALNTAEATILTFDSLGGNIPGTYGDNVSALCDGVGCYGRGNGFTPNITVEYRTLSVGGGSGGTLSNVLGFWPTNYGDLVNNAFPVNPTSTGEISLVPEPGRSIRLNSFDLAGWPNTSYSNQPLRILDENYNVLMEFSPFFVPGQGHATVTPNLTHGGILRIQFGNNWNVGIDNINFDQIAFADFTITKARIKFRAPSSVNDSFGVKGEFTLDVTSDGIDPATEEVVVTVGTASVTILAGSFTDEGEFKFFEGVISGADVWMRIVETDPDVFEFAIKADGVDLTDTTNPLDIALTIGDDSGIANLRLEGKLELCREHRRADSDGAIEYRWHHRQRHHRRCGRDLEDREDEDGRGRHDDEED